MNVKMLENFDLVSPRERFIVKSQEVSKAGWPITHVKVFDTSKNVVDPIFEYDRNYNMLKTFEPFRVWFNEEWKNFALISSDYMRVELLNLDEGGIITDNVSNLATAHPEGSSERFCPAEFYISDYLDGLEEADKNEVQDLIQRLNNNDEVNDTDDFWLEDISNFYKYRSFGFMSGCFWGDDWSYKLQVVDLSKIGQKEIFTDDRFGYVVIASNVSLRDVVGDNDMYYNGESQRFNISSPVVFEMEDGKPLNYSSYNNYPFSEKNN